VRPVDRKALSSTAGAQRRKANPSWDPLPSEREVGEIARSGRPAAPLQSRWVLYAPDDRRTDTYTSDANALPLTDFTGGTRHRRPLGQRVAKQFAGGRRDVQRLRGGIASGRAAEGYFASASRSAITRRGGGRQLDQGQAAESSCPHGRTSRLARYFLDSDLSDTERPRCLASGSDRRPSSRNLTG
jgi:hypothetical protein